MKKSLIVASILLAGSTLFAGDIKPFVGIDLSNVEIDYTKEIHNAMNNVDSTLILPLNESIKDTAVGFKLGAIILNKHRSYISYIKYSSEDGSAINTLFNYDYLFKSNEYMTPYIGIHAGRSEIEVELYDDFKISQSGTAYGIQGGIIYNATANIDLEIGVSYTMIDADIIKSPTTNASFNNGKIIFNNVQVTSEVENASRAFVGLNYKF